MEKEFVPYELALKLKELGFNELCFTYYEEDGRLSDTPKESGDDIKYQGDCKFDRHQNEYLGEGESCSAPTFSQAFRWFREKGYDVKVEKESAGLYFGFYWNGAAWIMVGNGIYEEAELACLDKLIQICIIKTKSL